LSLNTLYTFAPTEKISISALLISIRKVTVGDGKSHIPAKILSLMGDKRYVSL